MWFLEDPNQKENYSYAFGYNILDDEMIKLVYSEASKKEEIEALVGDDKKSLDIRSSKISWITPSDENAKLYQTLVGAVNHLNDKFFRYNLSYIEDLQFTAYSAKDKGHYNWHTDSAALRSPINDHRKLGFSILLNDPSEFEGGDFYVKNSKDDMKVPELKKGAMILFPSFLLHKVSPVTKGTRNSLVGWVRGPNFV